MLVFNIVLFATLLSPPDSVASEDTCNIDRWQCGDGSCISSRLRCNGEVDCDDGSDETHCRHIRQTRGGCVYPELPNDKTYFITDLQNVRPGDVFESIFINVTCQEGYGVNGSSQVFCVGGYWGYGASNQIAKCVRRCHLPSHPSVEYKCLLTGSSFGIRDCHEYEFEGTEVIPTCRSPIYHAPLDLSHMKCVNGTWDNVPNCVPDCGSVTPVGSGLVINGKNAERGEMPWHAGIYDKDWTPYMQVCGGSIISTQIVISAAHCFWTDVAGQQPASKYAVAVGKLYRPWDDKNDEAQKSDVKEIHLSDLYQGSAANQQDDIAVLIMTTAFEYKLHIRPVCVDFNIVFQNRQLTPGSVGKISGWGLTAANGTSSPILQVIELPYVSIDTCIADSPLQFRGYITSDKFCAGFKNAGKALCQGDSGGGLAFSGTHLRDMERYFLRGITSSAPNRDDFGCNPDTYITFTMIQKHEHFIKRYWTGEDDVWKLQSGDSEASQLSNCYMPYSNNVTTYKTTNNVDTAPGGAYPFLKLEITCAEGYSVESFDKPVRYDCYNGTWFPSRNIPECSENCRLPNIFGIEYACFALESQETSDDGSFICESNDLVLSGTNVEAQCTTFYQPENGSSDIGYLTCKNGSLVGDYTPSCVGVCGKRVQLHSRSPWNAVIYSKKTKPYSQICLGTLVSERIVLSAASCFWVKGRQQSADQFAVAVQKESQLWEHWTDGGFAQRSEVEAIYLPSYYTANASRQDDISVVILATSIEYTLNALPACLESTNSFTRNLEKGTMGKMAVYRFEGFDEKDVSKDILESCLTDPEVYKSYICETNIYNKISSCADVAVGTGWVYSRNEAQGYMEKYYLRSIAVKKQNCNSSYPVFMKLQKKHREFIRKVIRQVADTKNPLRDLLKISNVLRVK